MNLSKVLNEYYGGQWSTFPCPTDTIDDYDNIIWINEIIPTREEINAKIQELRAAEPLRLLRIERTQKLQETDWEVQRNTERNITDSNLIDYRNALRDLPQEIANGNIPAPTLDENEMLVFEHWPTRGAT